MSTAEQIQASGDQERDYPGRTIGTSFTNPDFELIGQAFGFRVKRMRSRSDLVMLPSILSRAGPKLIVAPGRMGGRRPVLNADKRAFAVRLYNERQMPIGRICAMMGISKPTLYSYVRAANGVTEGPPAK